MSNDRRVATAILTRAGKLVGTERTNHGDVAGSFEYIAEMWSAHINHAMVVRTGIPNVPEVRLDARDVLLMMTDVKRARAIYGDATDAENYVDGAGYLGLAGMLMYPDPAQVVAKGEPSSETTQTQPVVVAEDQPQHDPAAAPVDPSTLLGDKANG